LWIGKLIRAGLRVGARVLERFFAYCRFGICFQEVKGGHRQARSPRKLGARVPPGPDRRGRQKKRGYRRGSMKHEGEEAGGNGRLRREGRSRASGTAAGSSARPPRPRRQGPESRGRRRRPGARGPKVSLGSLFVRADPRQRVGKGRKHRVGR